MNCISWIVGSQIESRRGHTIQSLGDAKAKISACALACNSRNLEELQSLIATPSRNYGASILLEDLQGPSSSIRVSSSVRTPRPLSMSLSLLTSMVILTSIAATPS